MNKGQKTATVILIVAILMIITGILLETKEMITDYKCSTMSVTDMLTNKKCEKYKREILGK